MSRHRVSTTTSKVTVLVERAKKADYVVMSVITTNRINTNAIPGIIDYVVENVDKSPVTVIDNTAGTKISFKISADYFDFKHKAEGVREITKKMAYTHGDYVMLSTGDELLRKEGEIVKTVKQKIKAKGANQ